MCELPRGSGNGCRAPPGCKLKVNIRVPCATSKPRPLHVTELTVPVRTGVMLLEVELPHSGSFYLLQPRWHGGQGWE